MYATEGNMVPLSDRKIDAVLPLTMRDFERFEILQASMSRFSSDLGVCWVVTPNEDFKELARRIDRNQWRIVPESEIVPEFRYFPQVGGWFKQQLIKIAIAGKITTDFYLTLDADLFCTKALRYSGLIKDGRSGCLTVYPNEVFPIWYEWAERVLKLPRSNSYHNVTPTILSREAMLKMQRHLGELADIRDIKPGIGRRLSKLLYTSRLGNRMFLNARILLGKRPWAFYLLTNLPWTEYSLYYTFLEATGQFEKYHFRTTTCIHSRTRSLWRKDQIDTWDPLNKPDEDPSFFLVIQSNTEISPKLVLQKLQPLLLP
jgi:Family of unknown function (DUF6492)